MKLRTKIFLIFFLTGVVLTVGGVYSHHITSKQLVKEEIDKNLNAAAADMSAWINNYVEENKIHAGLLAGSPYVKRLVSDINAIDGGAEKFLGNYTKTYGYSNLYLSDREGKLIWSADPTKGIQEDDKLLAVTTDRSRQSGEPWMSDFAVHKSTGEPYSLTGAPVTDDKGLINGFVILETHHSAINKLLSRETALGPAGNIYLVGRDFLMRSDSPLSDENLFLRQRVDTPNSNFCIENLDNGHTGKLSASIYDDYTGTEVLGTHEHIYAAGWCLIAEISSKEALAPIDREMNFSLGLAAFIITFVFLIALLASSNISKPVKLLQKGTQLVERGNYNYRVIYNSRNELGSLANAFNRMVLAIKKSRAEIEAKVHEQTAVLRKQDMNLKKQQKAILNMLEDVEQERDMRVMERDKLNTMLYSIGDGVFVIDSNYRIEIFNQVASEISGYNHKEAIGKKYDRIINLICRKTGKKCDDFIKQVFKTGQPEAMIRDTILIRKDGTKVPVADSAAPLKDKKGKVVGCIVIFRDITKEVEIDKMKSEFVSIASHQLRSPLTGIKWFVQLLMDEKAGKLNPKQREFLKQINTDNERLIKLVEDLLDVSHIETGRKFEMVMKPTNLYPMLKDILKSQSIKAKNKKVRVKLLPEVPKDLTLNVDEAKVYQVFNNLVDNAIKYSRDTGSVQVGMKDGESGEIILFVKDDGMGIPPHQQHQIFEKFFRADNAAKAESVGTGLGLYIIKAIIEAHQGRIWFESVLDKGTTFYVSLPKGNVKQAAK